MSPGVYVQEQGTHIDQWSADLEGIRASSNVFDVAKLLSKVAAPISFNTSSE